MMANRGEEAKDVDVLDAFEKNFPHDRRFVHILD